MHNSDLFKRKIIFDNKSIIFYILPNHFIEVDLICFIINKQLPICNKKRKYILTLQSVTFLEIIHFLKMKSSHSTTTKACYFSVYGWP